MGRLLLDGCDPAQLSPLTLAFVGDGVFDLMVRERLVCNANAPVNSLNSQKVSAVRCQSQAEIIKGLIDELTEEELAVFKRGRNARTNSTPKTQACRTIIWLLAWRRCGDTSTSRATPTDCWSFLKSRQ